MNLFFFGDYEVIYCDPEGNETTISTIPNIDLYQDKKIMEIPVYQFDSYDIFLFRPINVWYHKGFEQNINVYAFAISEEGKAFSLDFIYENDAGTTVEMNFLTMINSFPIKKQNNTLVFHSLKSEVLSLHDTSGPHALNPKITALTLQLI